MRSLTKFLSLGLIVASAAALGCGDSKKEEAGLTIVKGKLVDGGKPFFLDQSKVPLPKGAHGLPPGTEGSSALQIMFIPSDGKGSFTAKANAESGTFEVLGDSGKGIPPGRYKIVMTAQLGMGPDTPDFFKGKYGLSNTKIVRDVKAGEEVVIDVSKADG